MKRHLLIFSTLIVIIVGGCSKENELQKSVLLYDDEFPDLPAYSEWGYNTFGVYYDREVFISNNSIVPAKVIVTNNSTSFVLDGQKGNMNYYSDYWNVMSITFKMSGFAPGQYTDLIVLNDTTLDLKNPACQVLLSIDTMVYRANILSGGLMFKRAQNLTVDKNQIEVILSGYFEFKALINDKPVTFSNGRFDVGISPDNFYNY